MLSTVFQMARRAFQKMDYIIANGLIWSLVIIATYGANANEDMKGQFDLIHLLHQFSL